MEHDILEVLSFHLTAIHSCILLPYPFDVKTVICITKVFMGTVSVWCLSHWPKLKTTLVPAPHRPLFPEGARQEVSFYVHMICSCT